MYFPSSTSLRTEEEQKIEVRGEDGRGNINAMDSRTFLFLLLLAILQPRSSRTKI